MKESTILLLTNAVVLTMDQAFNQYENGAIAIQNENILAVGPEKELQNKYPNAEKIDCKRSVLMPGLVNAHTHAAMTLLRGLADDLRLDVWLLGYMMPVEREFVSPDFVRLGSSLACIESIRSGVTCFADMYYFEEQVAQIIAQVGLRAVCSQTVLKFTSPDAPSYEEALDAARDFIIRWKDHDLIVPSVAPHSPYTCTEDILRASAALAVEFDVPLHTHLAETATEVENSLTDHGIPVIPYVKSINLFDAKVLAAHCVHIDGREIRTLIQHKTGVAHCPSSNLKLASGVAPVSQMLKVGLNVGIGTDGPASNNDLDMFEEIRLAALLAKGITNDPITLPAKTALSMATRIGAEALHLGDITGSLEPGKRADLILVDINSLHNTPRFHRDADSIYAQLVYSSKSSDVTDVMVNGNWLMRDREVLTINEENLLIEANNYAARIDAFLIKREQSVLSKLVAIGGAMEQESYEVQAKVKISDTKPVLEALKSNELEILYHRHYHEYDTYFTFDDPEQGQLRYREDEYIDENGEVSMIRYRLTMIGPTRERLHFPSDVLLSRSRYLATATHSLRFYREYFKPSKETYIEKDRLRWRILFRGTEFYINLDRLDQPPLGTFLEVKSRTWSRLDAENKANSAHSLLELLGAKGQKTVTHDYIELL
ncbi:MAG: amidohydrolase family protein [Anaerolineales bacterium]|jgi:5-methylthioadenosine/S-adenosylhomocysteine deaminase